MDVFARHTERQYLFSQGFYRKKRPRITFFQIKYNIQNSSGALVYSHLPSWCGARLDPLNYSDGALKVDLPLDTKQ